MPKISERFESFLGGLLASVKNHDVKLFVRSPAFKDHPEPTIKVTAPKYGVSGSALDVATTPSGKMEFPPLRWIPPHTPSATAADIADNDRGEQIVQYLLVVEDPDAPLPAPVVHGIYYAIPAFKTSVEPTDFEIAIESSPGSLRGGFRYGANRKKCVWSGPRPVLGHGVHRYVFQVVGLKTALEAPTPVPTRQEIERAIDGNVAGWGMWIGTYERVLH